MTALDSPNDTVGWWSAIKVGAGTAVLCITPIWLAPHLVSWLS
ncbi:hypothetical protein OG579_16975 [Williamsia herbipolensis]|uniref:Uncharacterized protein n=1 Tax=Williamsia herbipolensis TaxID=1603258 RepID=A0AAU4K071_9NOCA|nr:hypothetical protein [Williamsia herbipolensis]